MDNNQQAPQPSIYRNEPATPQTPPSPVPPIPAQPATPPPPAAPPTEMQQTPSAPPPKRSSRLPLLIVGFLVMLIAGLGIYIYQNMSSPQPTPEPQVVKPTPTTIPTATPTPIDESSTSASLNSERFYSEELGILFDHAKSVSGSGTQQTPVRTQTVGSRVYVYITGTTATNGQYVDVLSKVSTDDVLAAANKIIQQDAKFDTCSIQLNTQHAYPSTYQKGDLVCNGPGGGISYFLTSSQHPTKLLFVSIGQYGIPAETGNTDKMWQDTLHFLSSSQSQDTVAPTGKAL